MNMMLKRILKISMTPLLLLITGCSHAMSKNDTTFDWEATESAPKHYPMEIITGTFIYKDEAERGLYIPSGGTLTKGWGESISSHVVGPKLKPLPDRLKITFYSYAERQFYKGEFALPYDKILALFREGVAMHKARNDPAEKDYAPDYSVIMAGIAPGGVVAVWVGGSGNYIEVFFGQAEKINLDPSAAFALPFKDRQDSDAYIAKQLVNVLTPAELESLKRDGIPFDLWSRYRNRYEWLPSGAINQTDDVTISFLNGESEREWFWTDKNAVSKLRPVPRQVLFTAPIRDKGRDRNVIFEVKFDELETMAAFEKLGANGQKVYLDFEPRLPRSQIKVRLYNDKESIELKKFESADW